jgi:hypothetical protein
MVAHVRGTINTSMIPLGSLAKPSPYIPGTDPLYALWAYILGFVNRMSAVVLY